MKKAFKFLAYLLIISVLTGLSPVVYADNADFDTLIFAAGSRVVIKDNEKIEINYEPYLKEGKVYIPGNLAEEFLMTGDKDFCAQDLEDAGFSVYESQEYGFLAVGNVSEIGTQDEENIIKQFGIYISPDGNDSNEGYPTSPVKSFERARDLYREYREEDNLYTGKIFVHKGIYRFEKSFELNSQDTGIAIEDFGDGEVLLRGSKKLARSSFKKVTDSDFLEKLPEESADKIYEIDLSAYLSNIEKYPEYAPQHGGIAYYELFVGGAAQNIARWPNYGFALTGSVSPGTMTFESTSPRLEKWKNSKYGMVAGYWTHNWALENIYIGSTNPEQSTVTLSRALQYPDMKAGQRYYAMNMPEEMDIPGEYYIDCDTKKLYYYPSEAFLENDPELSILTSTMIVINGASNVALSGLTFEYTRGDAVSCTNAENIVIDGCVIRNIGNQAISMNTQDSVVSNCEIYNVGGAGVYMSAGDQKTLTRGNSKIINNNIYNFGRIFRTYQSAINISGVGNTASYNTIHDAPHSGIRFGGNDNVISHNEIYNVVLECSDSGAIYTGRNWTCWGNEISENYMHDIKKDESLTSFTVSAVYIDDMFCGTYVKNNVFENCTQAALFGGGKGNVFSGNILKDCQNGIDYDHRAVTGDWAHGSVISGGTVYEGLMNFLSDPKVDIELWKEKYPGFSQMLEDIYAYQENYSYETGYPKNVTITENKNYGQTAENDDYDYISPYVSEYGTVSGNIHSQKYGEITVPENGASDKLWNSSWTVLSPYSDQTFTTGEIEFVWNRAGGADKYEICVTDEEGNEILKESTSGNGYKINIDKKGKYSWKITAFCSEEYLLKEGNIEILKDSQNSGTFFAGTDFENVNLQTLRENFGWMFRIADKDSISVETDETGNSYLKMVRSEENLKSGNETYARLKFSPKEHGKITVTYDIMLENYRAGFRDMGSVQTGEGKDVMRLLTHLNWVYGMGTNAGRYNFQLSGLPGDSYVTVKRIIDLDNDTYSMEIYQDGRKIGSATDYQCSEGIAANLLFRFSYQNPFEPAQGSGDAVYRIDNVYVDMGELTPVYTLPENGETGVLTDSEINIKLNAETDTQSVDCNTAAVYENGTKLAPEDYIVTAEGRNINIKIPDGMKKSSEYRVVLSKNIIPDSLTHSAMTEDYNFSFETQKKDEYIYAAEGFEEYETGTLPQGTEWLFSTAEGDSLSIEKDIYGSKALKIVRSENNLYSEDATYAKLTLKNSVSEQPVTVSYDIRIENYRGGMKELGSVFSESENISSLYTNSSWLYGDSGYNTYLSTAPKDLYLTVKREIDTLNGVYSIWIYKDGELISTSLNRECKKGEASEIIFEAAYNEPYKIYGNSGDAVYWIDNIRVDSGRMGVYKTIPSTEDESGKTDNIKILFNCSLNPDTVTGDTLKIYKYSSLVPLEDYKVLVAGNMISIDFLKPLENGEECRVKITLGIMPENKNTIELMDKEFIFNFRTQNESYETSVECFDFEDWEGFYLNSAGVYHHNGWTFELSEGDSVSAEKDSVTGNIGLKLTKGSSDSLMKVYLDYKVSGDELIKVLFDTRFENQSRRIHDWGTSRNTDNSDFLKMVVYASGYWHRTIGDTKRYLCGLNENVTRVEQLLNPKLNEYTVSVSRGGTVLAEKGETASSGGIPSRLLFSVSNKRDDYAGEDTGNGVYWIDNVSVGQVLTPKVSEITTDNISRAEIIFNRSINAETVNKNNIKIYDNGKPVNGYSLICEGADKVIAEFEDEMSAGHLYTFEIYGVESVLGTDMLEKERRQILCSEVFNVNSIKDSGGSADIDIKSNLEEYVCVAALKDSVGKILQVSIFEMSKSQTIKYNYDAEKGAPEFYFWKSLSSMEPLTEKKQPF